MALLAPACGAAQAEPPKAHSPAAAPDPAAEEERQSLERLKPVVAIAESWTRRPELHRSYVGLEIMDVPSGRVIFSSNGHRRFVSASIAKVLTAACAYDTFGGDYTYRTTLSGYGEIRNSKLLGPLVLTPSQDPTLSSEGLRKLFSTLQGRVSAVQGQFVVSSVEGGGDHFAGEWLVQDWGQDWMPVSADFNLDSNVVPAGDAGRGYPLVVADASDQNNAMMETLLRSAWSAAWVVFNKSTNNVTYYRPSQVVTGSFSVGNPTDFNTAVAKMMLRRQGVKIENKDMPFTDPPVVFGEVRSKPLSEIIRVTLKESDNLYAQQLLRTLGTQLPANRALNLGTLEQRGLVKMNTWMTSIGVPPGDAILYDGCGLSRKNAVTPHALNVVLRKMAGPSGDAPFMDLMIHEGEGQAGTFRYKTGAMDSVRSISGVVRTGTGHPIAVTAIINDHSPSVRELRASLGSLIKQLEALGAVKLKSSVQPARKAVKNVRPKAPVKKRRGRHR